MEVLYQCTLDEYYIERDEQEEELQAAEQTNAREKSRTKTPHKKMAPLKRYKNVPLEAFWSQEGT